MPYTFGSATSSRVSIGSVPFAMNGPNRAHIGFAWVHPTTLTAGRTFWSLGAAGFWSTVRIAIDTVTNQMRIYTLRATTNGEYVTSDAGLALNEWRFIAFAINVGAGVTEQAIAWAGSITEPPKPLTMTVAVVPVGSLNTSGATLTVGNSGANNVAFQGHIAEYGGLQQDLTTLGEPPLNLSAAGSFTAAEEVDLLRRFIIPAWEGKWASMNTVKRGTATVSGCGIMLNFGPSFHSFDAAAQPVGPGAVTSATHSQVGHPRGHHDLMLHARRRGIRC